MMQVAVDQIVEMITVRDRFMTAAGPVDVIDIMAAAGMTITALSWIAFGDSNCVLFDYPILDRMMKMPFVQVVNMAIVFHSRMTTLLSMSVIMSKMSLR
jgi:hypothetical protein